MSWALYSTNGKSLEIEGRVTTCNRKIQVHSFYNVIISMFNHVKYRLPPKNIGGNRLNEFHA